MIRISLEGDAELIARLEGIADRGRRLFKEATEEATDVVRNRAVSGIANGPKTGRVYTHEFWTRGTGADRVLMRGRPRRGGPHQASRRGEYPASDTGKLMGSIWAEVNDEMAGLDLKGLTLGPVATIEDTLSGDVGADAAYAVHLEYKSPLDGGRPFLRRALTESIDDIEQIFLGLRGRIVDP